MIYSKVEFLDFREMGGATPTKRKKFKKKSFPTQKLSKKDDQTYSST